MSARVAVLIAYYGDRHRQFDRSLSMLTRQTYPDVRIYVGDDGADPPIADLCSRYANVTMIPLRPPSAYQTGANRPWRAGFERAKADGCDFVIITHPEILVPTVAVETMLRYHNPGHRSVPVVYGLSRAMSQALDEIPWRDDFAILEHAPGFMAMTQPWGVLNREAAGWRHHVCFSGLETTVWDERGFLPDTDAWCMDDAWLLPMESSIGKLPWPSPFAVYHQWHERLYVSEHPDPHSARLERIRQSQKGLA